MCHLRVLWETYIFPFNCINRHARNKSARPVPATVAGKLPTLFLGTNRLIEPIPPPIPTVPLPFNIISF